MVMDSNLSTRGLTDIRTAYMVVTSLMSSLSVVGCIIIITLYYVVPQMKTESKKMLVYLSISDFGIAVGNLIGVAVIEWVSESNFAAKNSTLCTAQAAISSGFSISSFFWTSFIALNSWCIVFLNSKILFTKMRLLCLLLSWGVPIIIVSVTLGNDHYGYDDYDNVTWWCWVTGSNKQDIFKWQLITGKLWEIIAYILVVLLYGSMRCKLKYQMREAHMSDETGGRRLESTYNTVKQKLAFVPLVFIIARMWGTISFIILYSIQDQDSSAVDIVRYMAPLQAAGDSSQGFLNCAVLIFTTPYLRKAIFSRRFSRGSESRTLLQESSSSQSSSESEDNVDENHQRSYASSNRVL